MAKRTRELAISLGMLFLASPAFAAEAPARAAPPKTAVNGLPMRINGLSPKGPPIQNQGLANPALKLTAAQKQQIDQILATYFNEEKALRQRFGTARDSPRGAQAATAARELRARLNNSISQILDGAQRKVWDSSRTRPRIAPVDSRGWTDLMRSTLPTANQ